MRVVSLNVAIPRTVEWKGMTVLTGIFKEPVTGCLTASKLNLEGDRQADLTVHGGLEKAIYGYPAEHYDYWRNHLPEVSFPWGKFGENLTTEGLAEQTLHIGDRVKIGSAILTVTQPRLPCYKLAIKFERDDIIKRFLDSGRSGFYFAVNETGEICSGSAIEIISRDPNAVSVTDIFKLYLGGISDPRILDRALKVSALPQNWKDELTMKAQAHRNR